MSLEAFSASRGGVPREALARLDGDALTWGLLKLI